MLAMLPVTQSPPLAEIRLSVGAQVLMRVFELSLC